MDTIILYWLYRLMERVRCLDNRHHGRRSEHSGHFQRGRETKKADTRPCGISAFIDSLSFFRRLATKNQSKIIFLIYSQNTIIICRCQHILGLFSAFFLLTRSCPFIFRFSCENSNITVHFSENGGVLQNEEIAKPDREGATEM